MGKEEGDSRDGRKWWVLAVAPPWMASVEEGGAEVPEEEEERAEKEGTREEERMLAVKPEGKQRKSEVSLKQEEPAQSSVQPGRLKELVWEAGPPRPWDTSPCCRCCRRWDGRNPEASGTLGEREQCFAATL